MTYGCITTNCVDNFQDLDYRLPPCTNGHSFTMAILGGSSPPQYLTRVVSPSTLLPAAVGAVIHDKVRPSSYRVNRLVMLKKAILVT